MTRPHTLQQSIEGLALAAPTTERWLSVAIRCGTQQGPLSGYRQGRRVHGGARIWASLVAGLENNRLLGLLP